MVLPFSGILTTQSTLFLHVTKLWIFIGIVFLAYISGIILPYPVVNEGEVFTKVQSAQQSSFAHVIRVSQIAKEQIQYKKAPKQVLAAQSTTKTSDWGVAKQIGEHTWTINVGKDEKIGTAAEILQALNAYRQRHGVGSLSWDTNLGQFAQGRADMFQRNGTTDAHAGFTDYIHNQDGFRKAGFMALGENSSFGYHVEGAHLIEWIYAADAPHNDNQLNAQWTHVGIGVAGTATDLVFAGKKI